MEGFVQLLHTPLGYNPHNVMSVGIPLHDNSYITWAARAANFERLRTKVAETPRVTLTAISTNATPPDSGRDTPFEILGKPSTEEQIGSLDLINTDYFAVLRIPLWQGRVWDETENDRGACRCHQQHVRTTLFPE